MAGLRLLCSLVITGFLAVGCGSATTPTSVPATASVVPTAQPTVEPSPASTVTAAPTSVPTAEPTMAPTLAPDTPTAGPTAAPLGCTTSEPWSQSQDGVSLSLCFEPHPPELGRPGRFSALLVDEVGQPIAEATLNMTLVGGMEGMEGEHDEDFSLELASQGEGLYTAEGTIGPSDLVLTGVAVRVRHGSDLWSFTIPASDLTAP